MKFQLKNFPEERIRILFKDNKKFIDESISYFGSQKNLANFLSISQETVYCWKKLDLFILLKHIKKIVSERNLNWDELEKEVIAYKGPNLSLIVRNPKLPIIESTELFAIIAHLIGDGSVNKNGIPIYTNSNKELIDNFRNLIRIVFGNVSGTIYKRDSGVYEYRTSRTIADLIKSFYNIRFDSYNSSFPERIKELPEEFSTALIKAFADDEGSVDLNHRINLYSGNKGILLMIRYLLTKKLMFRNISPIYKKSKSYYYLSIKSKDLEKFHRLIGFNHPAKMIKLSQILKIRKNSLGIRRKTDHTKNKIMRLLTSQNLSTEELIFKLGIRKSNVNIPLKQLKHKGLINQLNKKGQTIKWTKLEV